MSRIWILPGSAALLVGILSAQETPAPIPITLVPSTTKTITVEPSTQIMLPSFCDQNGNVYLRRGQAPGQESQIIRISANGKSSVAYEVPLIPEFKKSYMMQAWTVNKDGRVLLTVSAQSEGKESVYLIEYSSDGKVKSKSPIDVVVPISIVAQTDGDVIVHGYDSWKQQEKGPTTTVLLDSSGILKRRIDPKYWSDAAKASAAQQSSLYGGEMQAADDGTTWFINRVEGIKLISIDAGSGKPRTLSFKKPLESASAFDVYFSQGRALVSYFYSAVDANKKEYKAVIWTIYDILDGRTLANYQAPRSMPGTMVCFNPKQMKFLTGSDEGRFAFFTVDLQ